MPRLTLIIMLIVIAVMTLAFAPAFAQPSCWPNVALPIRVSPSSMDKVAVGEIAVSTSSDGMVWGYACVAPDGTMQHVIAGGLWSQWRPDWAAFVANAVSGNDEYRRQLWQQYVTSNAFDPKLLPLVDLVRTRLPVPAAPVPAGTWVVAPTSICAAQDKEGGVCVRRQSFTWDGKVRGLIAQSERATIGAACITSIGAEPYFGFDAQRTDRVVLCVRR